MRTFAAVATLAFAGLAACAGGTPENGATTSGTPQQTITTPEVPIACTTQPGSQPLGERTSPFDSARINIGGAVAQICYSRPSARGRTVMGGMLPYGKLWRTGANEPTILHLPVAAEIAGIRVEPGSYSVYTVPGEDTWTVIINRSTTQWGHEGTYTPAIQQQEVGRGDVKAERLDSHVEMFTIRSEPATPAAASLILEWERTRVVIPVRPVG